MAESPGREIDPAFAQLPYRRLAESALSRCRDFGVGHADFRFVRTRHQYFSVRDGALEGAADSDDLGFAVRVLHEGAWGFAAGVLLSRDEAVRVAEEAVRVAQVAAAMTRVPVALAPEPVHRDGVWVSDYEIDPFTVPLADKVGLFCDWTSRLLGSSAVDHAGGYLQQVMENTYYADLAGTTTTQQRVRLEPSVEAYATDPATGVFDSMRTIAPPVGKGWEYLVTPGGAAGFDFEAELATIPDLLAEKVRAPAVEPGLLDLVIHPSNLWLTIHESVGHATELDRALGYEASYAGTSFATYDQLGSLRYGSPVMHVTGDRTTPHGLATTGWDDEGVEAQSWDIVRDGVLVGYQLDRSMAHTYGAALNDGRSNGCAYADSPGHVPVQRMANVSLQPAADGPSTQELLGRVEHGLYVVGDRSWSIDQQRYNFQFTAQRFYRIEDGELRGQVRGAAYQGTTTEFWGSMEAVGGPQTYELGGAFNCGKAQPGQVASVSHGCPSALFRGVRVLDTAAESTAGTATENEVAR